MQELIPTEKAEQIAVIQYLKLKDLPYFHVPNSTYNPYKSQQMHNFAMGLKAGVPDLFVCLPGKTIAIELKRVKRGIVSPAQKQWIEILNKSGIKSRVCRGSMEAIDFIEEELHAIN